MIVKPNFFIVGAPKCGTTALHQYLRRHPNIFMPRVKEPHFFAADLGTYPIAKTLEEYSRLFEAVTEEHLRVGEASVYYLRSSVAIPAIRAFNPDAKIIAMFRNPVDAVYALHSQLLYCSEELVPDFEVAWRLQERRSRGMDLPSTTRSPLLVEYLQVGRFGTQAERLLSIFPSSQVKLILYDDFATSPRQVYDEVIEFLGVPRDDRDEFPRINENKRARLAWLRDFSRRPPPVLRRAFRGMKRAMGEKGLTAAKKKIVAMNTVRVRRPPLSPSFRAELVESFRDEVALLSQILKRDLSSWA